MLTAMILYCALGAVAGLLAGLLFFGEPLTPRKIVGAALVIAGVVLFAFSDKEAESE